MAKHAGKVQEGSVGIDLAPNKIPLNKIVVPLDGSKDSFRAASYAIKLAKSHGAEIFFVHAIVGPRYLEYDASGIMVRYIDEARRNAEEWHRTASEIAGSEGVKFSAETVLDVASAADAILNFAEDKKADLIVMGTKGRTGLKRFLLGSVASGVVAHARCSVLVVR